MMDPEALARVLERMKHREHAPVHTSEEAACWFNGWNAAVQEIEQTLVALTPAPCDCTPEIIHDPQCPRTPAPAQGERVKPWRIGFDDATPPPPEPEGELSTTISAMRRSLKILELEVPHDVLIDVNSKFDKLMVALARARGK